MKHIVVLGVCLLVVGCGSPAQDFNYLENQVGVGSNCKPQGGNFHFKYVEQATDSKVSCGPKQDETASYHSNNESAGLQISDNFCTLTGIIQRDGYAESVEYSFTRDWTTGSGALHQYNDKCDSVYSVSITRD